MNKHDLVEDVKMYVPIIVVSSIICVVGGVLWSYAVWYRPQAKIMILLGAILSVVAVISIPVLILVAIAPYYKERLWEAGYFRPKAPCSYCQRDFFADQLRRNYPEPPRCKICLDTGSTQGQFIDDWAPPGTTELCPNHCIDLGRNLCSECAIARNIR